MRYIKQMLGLDDDTPKEELSDEDKIVSQLADNIIVEFEKWIKPELTHILGEEVMKGIGDLDLDSIMKTQNKLLFLKHGVTNRKRGATFSIKLCHGTEKDHKVLSKFKYELEFPPDTRASRLDGWRPEDEA